MSTREKIARFLNLKPGWNFGNGVVPDKAAVERALELNRALCSAGLDETDAFLSEDGEIMVTAYSGPFTFEFEVEPGDAYTSISINHDDPNVRDLYGSTWGPGVSAEYIVRYLTWGCEFEEMKDEQRVKPTVGLCVWYTEGSGAHHEGGWHAAPTLFQRGGQ